MCRFSSAFCAVSLAAALPVSAQQPPDDKKADAPKEEKKDKDEKKPIMPPPSETTHEITVKGQKLAYKAVAGTIALTKPDGEPRANIFSIAYTKTGVADPASRPVTFCFNGGPGSSSVWLHLGAYGPKRVVLPVDGTTAAPPPYQLTDNEYTLLTDSDLVFIDPVSTGLSRAEKGEDAKQFHGYTEDIESLGDFIRLWVTQNNRWGSAKFLMGESYGGIRGSGLSAHLQSRYGMYLNGFIIVSGLLDFKTLSPDDQNDVPFLIWLPSMTAVAHYHKKLAPDLQADFAATLARAQAFCRGPYARALLLGSSLPEAERMAVAAELSALTSMPADFLLRQNLRLDPTTFRRKLLETEDKVIGRFDGRVTGWTGDPSHTTVTGAFSSAMNQYLGDAKGLNFRTDRPYEILTGAVQPWNYSLATNEYLEVASSLNSAFTTNPAFQVFIACGYHDLATPGEGIENSVRHMDLPQELRGNIHWAHYDGGHMMYTNLPSLEKLSADTAAFIRSASGVK